MRSLSREIRSRQSDFLEKRLVEAKARLETLKPVDQKRSELEAEIKSLEERVAQKA
jgi:Tfp pilus assembly protein PilN